MIIAKLDRLSRNAGFLFGLRDSGVKFLALDVPEVSTLTVGILSTLAQHEREIISARTKAALGAAKARGQRLGNLSTLEPGAGRVKAMEAAQTKAKARATDVAEHIAELRREGFETASGIARELQRRGIQTARGKGAWSATQVARVLNLAGAKGFGHGFPKCIYLAILLLKCNKKRT